uniref:(northern house mosquito) hypothetical protein n=1 Tax=Culex pipiens TaxID=7175 RepID=A0A8D8EYX5_CULPI
MLSLGWIVFLHAPASSSIRQDAPEGSSMFNNAELETLLHIATTFPAPPLAKSFPLLSRQVVAQFVAPSVIIEFRNFTKGLKLVTVQFGGNFRCRVGVSSGHNLQQKCGCWPGLEIGNELE